MSVKRHTAYNLAGAVIPLALALVTVPLYLKLVGADRYGVLSIAWLLLGYFGLFDLGLGRATSFRVAAQRDGLPEDRARTFWSALALNTAMGLVGGVVLWLAAAYFYGRVLKVDETLRPEILSAVPLLAASVPVATITGVLTGALQGREKFLETNVASTISTALFHVLPLIVAATSGPNLVWLLGAAMAARLLAVAVLGWRCVGEFGLSRGSASRDELLGLLKYGGWVNLTSIFGPLLVFVDRFAIGALLGAGAVAIYSVPFQLTRLVAILPSSFTNALFPRMSAVDTDQREGLAAAATGAMLFLISPLVLGGIMGIELFLHLWVGPDIAVQATPIGRILLVAFWANAFALLPFTNLQASGRPDLVTKILLLEIPFYLGGLYYGITEYGLIGCAVAFLGRCVVDCALLSLAARRPGRELTMLSLNGGLLCVGVVASTIWPIADWRWWVAGTALLGALLRLNWAYLPSEARTQIVSIGRRALQRV